MNDDEQKALDEFRASVDPAQFDNKPYVRKVDKPWGYEIHFTPDNLRYMGKIIHIDEGVRSSLQVHDQKQESWHLTAGNVTILLENKHGEMDEMEMKSGVGYTVALGQKHRLVGGPGGGDVFEVSTPEIGNTYRLEDDFKRSTETEAARDQRNRDAS